MKQLKKAIIPAAGLGTRFLPATKTVPKELLPIVDEPIILYVVEEAVRAGIEDIVLVAGRGKEAIEDFFDVSYELEDKLHQSGKSDILERLKKIRSMANIISIRQKQALGLGHAVYTGLPVVGNEAFAVLLGDEIMVNTESQPTCTAELASIYNETGVSAVAVMQVADENVHKYGIVSATKVATNRYKVTDVVEKPALSEAPSRLALPGRYVFCGDIFNYLRETKPGKNGEIQLTDAMTQVAKNQGLFATVTQAKRYDAGDKLGYLQANIEMALARKELGPQLKSYLKELTRGW